MWVDVVDIQLLGKEKSFLNSEGERIASQLVELSWKVGECSVQKVIGLCGTVACAKIGAVRKGNAKICAADLRFEISPSRNNPSYRFTTCYVDDIVVVHS